MYNDAIEYDKNRSFHTATPLSTYLEFVLNVCVQTLILQNRLVIYCGASCSCYNVWFVALCLRLPAPVDKTKTCFVDCFAAHFPYSFGAFAVP